MKQTVPVAVEEIWTRQLHRADLAQQWFQAVRENGSLEIWPGLDWTPPINAYMKICLMLRINILLHHPVSVSRQP